jgi:hypothetical protein
MSRVQETKQKLETLTLRMQFFCLDPKLENYREISNNTKLKNEQAELFDIWNWAVLAKYGKMWDLNQSIIQDAENKFQKESQKTVSMLLYRPTGRLLDKIWYIFFATGELNALQSAFEIAGNPKTSKELKENALKMFDTFHDEYRKRIIQTKTENPNFFENHETREINSDPPALLSSQVFERFDELLKQKTNEIKDLDYDPLNKDDINKILSATNLDKIVLKKDNSESSDDESDDDGVGGVGGVGGVDEADKILSPKEIQKKEQKKKFKKEFKEASSIFDDIAKNVMNKVKLGVKK